ncbi:MULTISPECIES: hypothetical protein [Acinetobacter]|uniref:Uncharacterized protein n=1 Tax=Acinetobacter higginsii TaxID=70347 RepID=N9T458_9GAMM|nr:MULTISPECIES: hypothetical protein [Acinetobacter]ENX58150.1 hypothetical protein F902_02550 [Acinetobacter higginsii]
MKKIILMGILFGLTGCASDLMSKANVTTSNFDNSKNISAREMPALAQDKWHPSNVFFGARWTDRVPDFVVLEVKYMHDYQNLNKLDFNVDGQLFSAKRMDVLTDLERNAYYRASKAPFVITVDQAKKILNSTNAKFRITTLSGQYTDGAIVLNGDKSMAYKSIKNVVDQIQ